MSMAPLDLLVKPAKSGFQGDCTYVITLFRKFMQHVWTSTLGTWRCNGSELFTACVFLLLKYLFHSTKIGHILSVMEYEKEKI